MKKSELAPFGMWPGAKTFAQLENRRVAAGRAERSSTRVVAPHDPESKDALVVGERPRNVRNLQSHHADVCGRWEPKTRRCDAAVLSFCGVPGRANGFK